MPLRIPQYQPQVGVRAAPGGPGPIQVSAEGVRMHARAQQAQAQSLQAMGNVVAGIHDDMKRAAAAEEVLKVQASFKEFLTEQQAWKEQALTERVGTRAMGLYQDADNHWATQIERAAEGLTPRQAEKFLEFATQARPGFLASMSRHQASEAQRTTLQTNEELVVLHGDELTEALLAGDMDSVQLAMDRLRSARGQQAAMTGATQEWLNGRIRMDRNKATATALGAMLERKDWGNAGRLLEADDKRPFEQQWLTSDQRSSARSRIEAGARQDRIVQATDWYYLENQGSMTEALAAVRENVPADIRFDVERSVTARFQEAEFLREKESEQQQRKILSSILGSTRLQESLDAAAQHPDPARAAELKRAAYSIYGMAQSGLTEAEAVRETADRLWNEHWVDVDDIESQEAAVQTMIDGSRDPEIPAELGRAVRAEILDRVRLQSGVITPRQRRAAASAQQSDEALKMKQVIALDEIRRHVADGYYDVDDNNPDSERGMAQLAAKLMEIGRGDELGSMILLSRSVHGRPVPVMTLSRVESFIADRTGGTLPEGIRDNIDSIYTYINDMARRSGFTEAGDVEAMINNLLLPSPAYSGWFGIGRTQPVYMVEALATGAVQEWQPDPGRVSAAIQQYAEQIFKDRAKDPRMTVEQDAMRIAALNQHATPAYLRMNEAVRRQIEINLGEHLTKQHKRQIKPYMYEVVAYYRGAEIAGGQQEDVQMEETRARERREFLEARTEASTMIPPTLGTTHTERRSGGVQYAQTIWRRRVAELEADGTSLTEDQEKEVWEDVADQMQKVWPRPFWEPHWSWDLRKSMPMRAGEETEMEGDEE